MKNSPENTEKNGPAPEDPQEVRKELRALIAKSHPDRLPEEVRSRAAKLMPVLTTLLDEATRGKAIRTWSELAAPGQSSGTFKEGDVVELVRVDESGEIHGGQVKLPKWTKIFRNAVSAFYAGQSIDEVRHLLDFDPVAADRVARRELSDVISRAQTVTDLIKSQDEILKSKFLLDKTRQDLLREVVGRIAGAYTQELAKANSLNNLRSLSDEVKQLIEEGSVAAQDDKDYFLGVLSMIIDVHAESLAKEILENSDDIKTLDAIASFITAVSAFNFANPQKAADLLRLGNESARKVLMNAMQKTRTEKGLERLHEYVYRFPFSADDAGEEIRKEIHAWIEKKWYSYLSPEALENQSKIRSASENKKS